MMLKKLKKKAFSLVEVLIAMAVILIGLAGVTGSLSFGMQASQTGDNVTQASNLCRILIESMVGGSMITNAASLDGDNMPDASTGLNDAATDRVAIDAAPFNNGDVNPGTGRLVDTVFTRNITTTRRGASGTMDEFLALVTVRVFWFEKGVEKNVTMSAIVPHANAAP